ncbi:MAG: hypothetical protein DHS20C18_45200 [Saprospiraceae bacterium]|nr:MAG: hypothetical protein DHS20C18_45200 [Saprospiraceae bacterium]
MKFSYIYSFFALCVGAFFLLNNALGAAEIQGEDRTRSPLSGNTSCQTCHNSGTFSPTIAVEILDGSEMVSNYQPGKAYTLKVKITPTNGSPIRYGFQAVALMGDDNVNAGSFSTPPSGIQVITLNDRDYAEHSTPNTTDGNFEIEWVAPAAGSGPVRFYSSGNAANGNGTSGGDGGVTLQTPLTLEESVTSGVFGTAALFVQMTVAPNPVQEQLTLSINNPASGNFQLAIRSLDGRLLQKRQMDIPAGQQNIPLDVSDLNSGLYLLQLTDGQNVSTRKFVKQ